MKWPAVRLGELMPMAKSSLDPRKSPDQEFDLFSIPAFDAGRPEVVRGAEIGSSKQTLQPGDVLLSKIVPHIRRACVVPPKSRRPMIGSSEWIIFRSERFDPAYLRHALVSDRVHRAFMQTVAGVGGSLLRARPSHVAEIEIPLPPIEEQRRIAAVLDAADALRAKRRQALVKLDTLTQAIFIDMFGDPLLPRKGLASSRLGDVASFVRGVTFKPADVLGGSESGSVQVMRTANVQSQLDTSDVWHIASRFVKREEQFLRPLDTLISSANSWNLVGRCCLIPTDLPKSTFGGFVTVLRVADQRLTPRYVHAWFSSAKVQRTARSFGRRTTNISNLDLAQCADLTIAVPAGRELEAFELALEKLNHETSSGQRSLARLDALFASLQQRAFRGEL